MNEVCCHMWCPGRSKKRSDCLYSSWCCCFNWVYEHCLKYTSNNAFTVTATRSA